MKQATSRLAFEGYRRELSKSERRLAMRYVGPDAHRRQSTNCVLDHRGQKLLSRTIKGPWSKVLEGIGRVKKPFAVCFDAEKLAKLSFLDEVPPVYVPSSEERDWRGFIEYRYKLVCEQTRAKNAIRELLRGQGIQALRGSWYGPGTKWLRSVSFANELDTVRRNMLYERLCFLSKMIERVEATLARATSSAKDRPLCDGY